MLQPGGDDAKTENHARMPRTSAGTEEIGAGLAVSGPPGDPLLHGYRHEPLGQPRGKHRHQLEHEGHRPNEPPSLRHRAANQPARTLAHSPDATARPDAGRPRPSGTGDEPGAGRLERGDGRLADRETEPLDRGRGHLGGHGPTRTRTRLPTWAIERISPRITFWAESGWWSLRDRDLPRIDDRLDRPDARVGGEDRARRSRARSRSARCCPARAIPCSRLAPVNDGDEAVGRVGDHLLRRRELAELAVDDHADAGRRARRRPRSRA